MQIQAKADADVLLARLTAGNSPPSAARASQVAFLAAYRWQYIVSGVQDERFLQILGGMITAQHNERIGAALQPILAS